MRKLKIIEHISLDGVIQHSADDSDFPYSDWTAPYRTPAGRDAIIAVQGESFDLLLGRRTYDLWSGFWPKAQGSPMADGLNAATKYVATHRPESLEWGPFEGLGPDIVEGIRRIKSQDGPDLILWGSSTLISTLLEHGLADEVVLATYPVLLGTGKRFLAEGTPARAFELVSTTALPSGIILSTYKVAGPLLPGPVAAYFAAEKGGDADALARCFAEHGFVRDEGGEFTGVTAIREWNAAARLKYHHTVEPLSVFERDGQTIVIGRVSGDFPNSPLSLEHAFVLEGDKIATLVIR